MINLGVCQNNEYIGAYENLIQMTFGMTQVLHQLLNIYPKPLLFYPVECPYVARLQHLTPGGILP